MYLVDLIKGVCIARLVLGPTHPNVQWVQG